MSSRNKNPVEFRQPLKNNVPPRKLRSGSFANHYMHIMIANMFLQFFYKFFMVLLIKR